MGFGQIIKKSWTITWRYRALWVLGVFAGVTGSGGGGGGGNTSSFRNAFRGSGGTSSGMPTGAEFARLGTRLAHLLPAILVGVAVLVLIGFVFGVLGIGARGGLVWAVNEIEEGRRPGLGEAWGRGFSRFWSVLGLGIMLQLPIVLAFFVMLALILVPILGPLMRGGEPSAPAVIAPVCGVLAIGLPLLIVAGAVLGILYIVGVRVIVLEGIGAVDAIGVSWRGFRARIGDHVLMYLINLGLNVVASIVIAIPIAIFALVAVVPAVIAVTTARWAMFGGAIAVFVLVVLVLSFAYAAIWGTFTSSLWTIFYRRLTRREIPAAPPAPPAPAPYGAPPAPPAGYPQQPPAPPASPVAYAPSGDLFPPRPPASELGPPVWGAPGPAASTSSPAGLRAPWEPLPPEPRSDPPASWDPLDAPGDGSPLQPPAPYPPQPPAPPMAPGASEGVPDA